MEVRVEDENSAIEGRRLPEASAERQSVEAPKSCGEAHVHGMSEKAGMLSGAPFEPFPSPPQPYSFSLGESLPPRASSIYLPKIISSIYSINPERPSAALYKGTETQYGGPCEG